jgi:hypothetical protein
MSPAIVKYALPSTSTQRKVDEKKPPNKDRCSENHLPDKPSKELESADEETVTSPFIWPRLAQSNEAAGLN